MGAKADGVVLIDQAREDLCLRSLVFAVWKETVERFIKLRNLMMLARFIPLD